jgi:hypothetical protein
MDIWHGKKEHLGYVGYGYGFAFGVSGYVSIGQLWLRTITALFIRFQDKI